MDHSYQLSRPSIETIIDYCNDLLADEKLTVFEFGENCDLVLHIYKDEEFNMTSGHGIDSPQNMINSVMQLCREYE